MNSSPVVSFQYVITGEVSRLCSSNGLGVEDFGNIKLVGCWGGEKDVVGVHLF